MDKDKKYIILGVGQSDKLVSRAAMDAAMNLLTHNPKIEYPDPMTLEESVALYNAEHPDQHTTVEILTLSEIKDKYGAKYIAGIDPYEGQGNGSPNIHEMDEVGQFNMDRLPYPELVEELSNFYTPMVWTALDELQPTYKIVKDEEALKRFIDFLPDLEEGQKFYYSLFARKKYGATEGLKSDKCQLKRGTTTKERMLRDFKKLETVVGTYTLDDLVINQDSLVLYITPNPRDMHKAALNTAKTIVSDMAQGKRLKSPSAMALNEIQTAGVKKFFNVDIDFNEKGKAEPRSFVKRYLEVDAVGHINGDAMHFVNTRGGFHILVELDKIKDEYKKTWYMFFNKHADTELYSIDMSNGDGMLPVCGCVQSDFVPYLD